jgi:excisionase family DNA binding protein
MSTPALLTPEQVAQMLGIPVNTLYAWRYRGTGPVGLKVGRHVRYAPEDVDAWLAEQRDNRPA